MASTIRDLLVKLGDLRYQISNSTSEPSKRNSYLLAISSAERLLSLLQSVLMKIDLNSLFSRVFEVKDLIQDIIFDWNSNNPQPLSKKFFTSIEKILQSSFSATTTSPNDSLAEIKKVLDDLDSSLYSMKLDILSFSGESALVEEYLKRNSAIQSAVKQLQTDLIFIDVEKSTVHANLLTSSFRKLREDLNTFLNDYQSKFKTQLKT